MSDDFSEEILFEAYDSGWNRILPVKLIRYKGGHMDIHRQTGPDFDSAMERAEKLLLERGLKIDKSDKPSYGSTGRYQAVVEIKPAGPKGDAE